MSQSITGANDGCTQPSAPRFSVTPVGLLKSCYKQKFGIPRQAGLVANAQAFLELLPPFDDPRYLHGLEEFSHAWLIFHFHATGGKSRCQVRPPRLGGKTKLGVYATRSPFRPNNLGLSLGKIEKIVTDGNATGIRFSGLDIMDETPVLDLKPYLPYADSVPEASAGYADARPAYDVQIVFSALAAEQCAQKQHHLQIDLFRIIREILLQDPRPAYRQREEDNREYKMRLYDFDLKWIHRGNMVKVISLC